VTSSAQEQTADAVDFAYQRARRAILSGELAPGEAISQVKVAAEFGISRTPLREAFSRLAAEGLVTSTFNRRMRVSELDLDDFEQIYAIRMSVEPGAIEKTAPRLTTIERHEIDLHLDGMDAAARDLDMDTFRSHHRAFHMSFTQHAGGRICQLLEDMWDYSERYRLAYLHYSLEAAGGVGLGRIQASQVDHREIFAALSDGDVQECAALQVAHMKKTLDGVLRDAAAQTHH